MADLIERLRAFEGSDELGNGDFSLLSEAAAEIEALRAEVERVTCELMDAIAHAEKLAEASRQLVSMYERATGLPCPPQLRRAIAALRERLVERDIKD